LADRGGRLQCGTGQHHQTLFTTGNGYLGTRGSLEEGHEGALAGTFLRGVYYEPLTLHKSSLSTAIHSIMGIEVGDPSRAVQYFRRAAFVDLADLQGNTQEGIYIASAGGTWQMIVCGFGGFRVRNGQMTFKPWLPPDRNALDFRLKWHGNTVSVSANHASATFVLSGPEGRGEMIIINGHEIPLQANSKVTVDLLRARP